MRKGRNLSGFIMMISLTCMMQLSCDDGKGDSIDLGSGLGSSATKMSHREPSPSIFKNKVTLDEFLPADAIVQKASVKPKSNVSLTCYRGNICLVKDTRVVKVNAGINCVEFENLLDGLIPQSLHFRTPGTEKIKVLSYEFKEKDNSRRAILEPEIGRDVYYNLQDSTKLERGKLFSLLEKNNSICTIVDSDRKRFILPIDKCVGIVEHSNKICGKNRVKLSFDSSIAGDLTIEISYLIRSIKWDHFCSIDVFEKMDRIDILSQASLKNETTSDLNNVNIIFDTSAPKLCADQRSCDLFSFKDFPPAQMRYESVVDVEKRSTSEIVLRSDKVLKPRLEYISRIPSDVMEKPIGMEIPIKTGNLLIIEDRKKIGLNSNFESSNAFLFLRKNNERNFLGRQKLSSFKKDDNLVFEIGHTSDIMTMFRQTDFRALSEKQFECGVRVSVRNNTNAGAVVLVVLDVDSPLDIVNKSLDTVSAKKPMWSLKLEPNEIKELYFRVRMNKPMKLLEFPNPLLYKKCQDVALGDQETVDLLEKMANKLHEWNGVGLAAPQVGVTKNAIVAMDIENNNFVYKMINPKIIWKSDNLVESHEGCLSIPGIQDNIMRHDAVIVEYLDVLFSKKTLEASGFLAICIQHEVDHLNGKLFIDRMSPEHRRTIVEEFNKKRGQAKI